MFLRRNRRMVDGECYEYWTLVRTVRTAKGPRQEIVATLGKEPGLESRTRHGWEDVADLLEGRTPAPEQGRAGPGAARSVRHAMGAGGCARACASSGCGISDRFIWRCRCGGGWACTAFCGR